MKVQDSNLQTDAELLKQFSGSGSHSAFATLVERHGPMVHAVAMRTLSNHHDAQDVTQATFLVLAREAEALSRKPSVAGWLHTVSRRLSLDAHRSRESRQRREAAAMNETVNLTRDAISTGFRRELDAALDGLPERYRHPLVLFHLEGASLDEVARRLDLQPSTLRTRLSRAREMLRNILVRRGVEVASVAALSSFFTAEAKAAAFTPSLLSSVVSTATGNGAGVSTTILQLAGKAACGTKPISITTSITSLTILMKAKATLVAAILLAIAAVGTTAYVVNHESVATQSEAQGADPGKLAAPAEGRDAKSRQRAPQFQSIEEAEQALIDFDLTPIFGSDREDAKRCSFRLRSLSAKIPSGYYSELAARFRGGSDSNLKDYFRQMALYMEWGRLDLAAALADLPRIDDAKMHSKALENVFRGSTEADAMAAMKKAEILVIEAPHELSDTQRISLMDAIFDTWIESDPFSAVEWAKQAQVPDKLRNQWINDGLRTWSEKDPDASEKWRKQQNLEGIGR
ncbi:MAG: sigma-70 family RNA polymerase sigma factor [Akkermansiaceae bacterium]|nr:sigma-70 family RNA polymerase sigma factor [Akkermansiaceae bacterium]MCF7733221.1 sigma-70 family RNA polymerase sigma factor [Akkermansiaceae bacterium]